MTRFVRIARDAGAVSRRLLRIARDVAASRGLGGAAIALTMFGALFLIRVATTGLPAELRVRASTSPSIRFVDREGRALREVRAGDATRSSWVALDDVGPLVVRALLAAEDQRFFEHPGVDPLAVVRAMLSDARHARVVSGASTLTMQLARLVRPHPRNLLGKIDEAAFALRIEASLRKRDILEQYVNRAPFGAGVRGIDAASRFWFDKAPRDLSLAEAATLAAIPRGPAVYALDRHPDRVVRRRDRILERMRAASWISSSEAERAEREPLVPRLGKGGFGAPHFVEGLRAGDGSLWPRELGDTPVTASAERVETTIDGDLQREIELAVREQVATLAEKHVTAASVVVLDNASGDVLAYVGSPDFGDDARGGQNDGVRALRQPGSTLKPFVYGLAMERLGWTAATSLPDVELRVAVPEGTYMPMNFDERFHGPVRLRDALGSSLNVPAVWAAEQIGTGPVLERLRALGFVSLTRSDDWYGPAVVLGDGEVTLLQLASAYATLARGGTVATPRAVRRVTRAGSVTDVSGVAGPEARRVMPADVAAVLTDVLSDSRARVAAFGEHSALDLPFAVAAKTGTSKGSRDNWTVGFTREVTVAVWVGNFDGSPMRGTSGITGAAPIFHAAMEAAMRGRDALPLRLSDRSADAGLVAVEVCPLSGGRPTDGCPHSVREWMRPGAAAHLAPCAMHTRVAIDSRNGLRAGPTCPSAFVSTRTFERYDETMTAWASSAQRPVAPVAFSPLCPGSPVGPQTAGTRIGWPRDGARFVLDPDRARDGQMLLVRVEAAMNVEQVELRVDGRPAGRARAPFVVPWPLARGEHVLEARSSLTAPSAPVTVVVE